MPERGEAKKRKATGTARATARNRKSPRASSTTRAGKSAQPTRARSTSAAAKSAKTTAAGTKRRAASAAVKRRKVTAAPKTTKAAAAKKSTKSATAKKATKTATAKKATKAAPAKKSTRTAAAKKPAAKKPAARANTKKPAKTAAPKARTAKPATKSASKARAKAAKPSRAKKPVTSGQKTAAAKTAKTARSAKTVKTAKAPASPATPRQISPADASKVKSPNGVQSQHEPTATQAVDTAPIIKRKPTGKVRLPKGYKPTDSEEFMSRRQQEYFRLKLLAWREGILSESRETIIHLQQHSPQEPDLADRASIETDRLIELRTRDRERKLLSKIDDALERIEDGSYGFCEETGEPISLKRLEARPIATLSIDAQERHERMEKIYRDD